MRRRDALAALGAAAAAWPLGGHAQEPLKRVGVIMAYRRGDGEGEQRLASFRDGLREAGWVEGRNVRLDVRWTAGDPERAKAETRSLVEQSPDVILANGTPPVAALRQLTSTVPIVFVIVTNPVGAGFVQSLARPGGNVTGFSTFEPEIGGKWLEFLKAISPAISRVGVLYDPEARGFTALWTGIEASAPAFRMQAAPIHARSAAEIEAGIAEFARAGGEAIVVLPVPINSVQRRTIFGLAERYRLPAIYPFAFHARDGGLAAYGFDAQDLFRRAGPYVARILGGDAPGDLPVQAPTKYELAINLKTAAAQGLTISPALLARADEVIE